MTWCPCTSVSGWCNVTTAQNFGAGYANTQAILNHPNHASATATNCAAKACAEYKTATTTAGEWFLPNYNDATRIYLRGTFTEIIWTSENNNIMGGCIEIKLNGCGGSQMGKNVNVGVRAVRAF